jgi:hypothetical protein
MLLPAVSKIFYIAAECEPNSLNGWAQDYYYYYA